MPSGIRRELGTAQREAAPLLTPSCAALPATLLGTRDRALLLLGCSERARFVARRSALDVPDLVVDAEGFAVTIRRDVGGEAVRRRGSIFTELTRLVATVDSAQLAVDSVSRGEVERWSRRTLIVAWTTPRDRWAARYSLFQRDAWG